MSENIVEVEETDECEYLYAAGRHWSETEFSVFEACQHPDHWTPNVQYGSGWTASREEAQADADQLNGEIEMEMRYFEYVGDENLLTRGEHGVAVIGARTSDPKDPDGLYTFDPSTGDVRIAAVDDPNFVEITEEEYAAL